jgi:hypothetical protein
MPSFSQKWTVLAISLSTFLLIVLVLERSIIAHAGGHLSYPLDDTFIHMAIARNLAFHGVWGISPTEFQSASSSIFYTLILALLFKLFSVNILIPFLLNLVTALFTLILIQNWLDKKNISARAQIATFMALFFFTPLPIIVVSGMEHTLQCLFSILFLFTYGEWLERSLLQPDTRKTGLPWQLPLYGMLVTSIRYEGLFMVGMACLILLYYRKIMPALLLGSLSLLPLLIFGAYSVSKGSYFLPNSVLLKSDGAQLSVSGILHYLTGNIFPKLTISTNGIATAATQHLLVILPLVYLLFRKPLKTATGYGSILIILTGSIALQLCLASTGWFYRYEASLVFCSVLIVSMIVASYGSETLTPDRFGLTRIMTACLLFILILPLLLRSGIAFQKAGQACGNIYSQQYQMARFVSRYYNGSVIAANDIGAISFYKQQNNLDIFGLGNITVARRKMRKDCTPQFLDSLTRSEHTKIAVVYDSWFSDSLRSRWSKVASWTIPNNVICGDSIVSFYAIDPGGIGELKRALVDFAPTLPADVAVHYFAN